MSERRSRPDLDLEVLDAHVGGLDCEEWRSRTHYGCIVDPDTQAVPREQPYRAGLDRLAAHRSHRETPIQAPAWG